MGQDTEIIKRCERKKALLLMIMDKVLVILFLFVDILGGYLKLKNS